MYSRKEAGPRVAAIVSIVETCRRLCLRLRDYLSSVHHLAWSILQRRLRSDAWARLNQRRSSDWFRWHCLERKVTGTHRGDALPGCSMLSPVARWLNSNKGTKCDIESRATRMLAGGSTLLQSPVSECAGSIPHRLVCSPPGRSL
jgi:hypothetical protein